MTVHVNHIETMKQFYLYSKVYIQQNTQSRLKPFEYDFFSAAKHLQQYK